MIKVYVSPTCSSCRKVKQFFHEQHIPFEERNIFKEELNDADLKEILAKSENGTEDIIATKSKIMKEQNVDLDNMTISEMIAFVRENPSVLRRPIVVDDRHIQVGYDADEMTTFIPRAKKFIETNCSDEVCETLKKSN